MTSEMTLSTQILTLTSSQPLSFDRTKKPALVKCLETGKRSSSDPVHVILLKFRLPAALVRVSSYYRVERAKPLSVLPPHAQSRNRASLFAPPREQFLSFNLPLLISCYSLPSVSVAQWKSQFMQWSNVTDRQIAVFTADQKEKVTSYSLL
jgi:hypothetical protein